tara:strand:+ start:3046 stop:3303 length:258 start_codon:yes stop_codon:yes gene_type:complete
MPPKTYQPRRYPDRKQETAKTPPKTSKSAEPKTAPTLAETESGFKLGVEAACERVAKNSRLGVKMSTGMTMGEDIANHIRKDLLG